MKATNVSRERERCDCNYGCLKETGHLNEEKNSCVKHDPYSIWNSEGGNQCDGCCAGIPVDDKGVHLMGSTYPGRYSDPMFCTKDRYT